MKRISKVLLGIVVCLTLLVFGFSLFIVYFDWNRAKPEVNRFASTMVHRPFAVNGKLSVQWAKDTERVGWRGLVPWPHVEAQDVVVGNPATSSSSGDWQAEPAFVKIEKVSFTLDPLALLEYRVAMPGIVLQHPEVNATRNANGQDNWTFVFGPEPSPWHTNLGRIVIDNGHINVRDDKRKLQVEGVINTIDSADGYGVSWTLDGHLNQALVKGEGKAGAVLSLEQANPYPLEATLQVGKTHVDLKGTLTKPSALAALDLHMKLSGASMADIHDLTGITLPETPPYSTQGHLIGTIDAHGGIWKYDNFTGRVGTSDLSGQLRYESARERGRPRPFLGGNLISNLLAFKDLAPIIGADKPRPVKAVVTADGKSATSAKVLPNEAFKFTRWRDIDADVVFTGRKIIRDEKLPIDNLLTHIVLRDGTLSLLPLEFGVADGHVAANVVMNGNGALIKADMNVSARHLKLNRLMPDFKPMQTSFGEINGDAKLGASGSSVASLLGASNGEIKVLVNQGRVSKLLLDEAGLNVVNVLLLKLFGDKQVKLNCLAGDFVVKNGLMETRNFLIDTDEASIGVGGNVDLGKETLDLTVQPENKKFRLVSLRSPVYVTGTFADPKVNIDKGKLALRTGGAVALGVLTPIAALLPLVDVGPGKDSECAKTIRETQTKIGRVDGRKMPP